MKLWKTVLFVTATLVVVSCGIQKTPPAPLSGPWLDVPSTVKIDTLSYTRLNWKMRNSFTFRWNYAKFASNQPFSFYSSASFARFWNPFNSFDMYWNRHNFWYDWAFGYPYFNYRIPRYYMYEEPRNIAIMKERRRTANVDIIANKLRKKVDYREERIYKNPNNVSRSWNNNIKVEPRENPNRFESKITPRQDINNYNNNRSGRDIVNSTKVIMKKGGN